MQHKFAPTIRDIVVKILDDEQSIFINAPHSDKTLHFFISTLLSEIKNKIKIFFVEAPDAQVQAEIHHLKTAINASEKNDNVKFSEQEKIEFISSFMEKEHLPPPLIPILHASILYDISIIGIDVSQEEKKKLNSKSDAEIAAIRLTHNDEMIKNIQKHAKNKEKYVFHGGFGHTPVATALGIKKISIFNLETYVRLQTSKQENLKNKDNEPDYAYIYTEQDKIITFKQLDLPLFNPQTSINSLGFSSKIDGVLHTFVNKLDLEKQVLKSKYTLKDTSIAELESGWRTAANNNQFDDMKKFVTCGVNINSQSPSNLKTAFHYAIEKQHVKSIEVLLELDAKINIPDKNGQTVLDLVKKNIESFNPKIGLKNTEKGGVEKFSEGYKLLCYTLIEKAEYTASTSTVLTATLQQ